MTGREALERAIAAQGEDWVDAADWLAGRVLDTLAEVVAAADELATDFELSEREPDHEGVESPQPMDGIGMGVIARSLGIGG